MTRPSPPQTLGSLLNDKPVSTFASDWEQYWYEAGLQDGFDAGKVFGYQKAVEESYPELTQTP